MASCAHDAKAHYDHTALAETLRAQLQVISRPQTLAATYPEIFSRAWADHEAMPAGLDDLVEAAERGRAWVVAKQHATVV